MKCRVNIRIRPTEMMSIRVTDLSCYHAPYYVFVAERGPVDRPYVFKSSEICGLENGEHLVIHGYTSFNTTDVIFVMRTFFSRETKYRPLSAKIHFTSHPQSESILWMKMTSSLHGYISTPFPDFGNTLYFYRLDTWLAIPIPAGHGVILSVVRLDCQQVTEHSCMTISYLGLYEYEDFINPLEVHCGKKLNVGPSSFAVSSGRLYFRFVDNHLTTGFKLLFSLHPRSAILVQRTDGTWNCSVPQWPDFRHHFPCNVYADCLGREDEASCSYTTPVCGEGRLTSRGSCYVYATTKRPKRTFRHRLTQKFSWGQAETKCRMEGGHLASFNSFREMLDVYHLLISNADYTFVFIGMTVAEIPLPALYMNMWANLDGNINHYAGCVKPRGLNCANRVRRVALMGEHHTLFRINRDCPINQADALCEVPPDSRENRTPGIGHRSGIAPHKAMPRMPSISLERNDFLWDDEVYTRCSAGHMTHAFLACDFHSACWARDFSASVLCSAPLTPLPPAMLCENGVQYVPYTLVCDHRSDCDDNTDEDFCVFIPFDILTQFQCSNGQRVPIEKHCDERMDCNDASDERECPLSFIFKECGRPVLPPAILLFDGYGQSKVRPLNQPLVLDRKLVNGTLTNGTIVNAELVGHTLVKRSQANETMVSGILAHGTLVSGTLVMKTLDNGTHLGVKLLASGTPVYGKLVSGWLVQGTHQKTSLVNSMLLNATLVSGTSPCPDTHFQCADDSYCVPVFTRCNRVYDCPGREDEDGCNNYQCPGFYRCRGASTCVHRHELCDGITQCLQNDDEMMCDLTCPYGCTCYGYAFFCSRVTAVYLYPKLRYLDASDSGIRVQDLQNNMMLVHLSLVRCKISVWDPVSLPNLRSLDLSVNNVTQITTQFVHHLPNLRHLALAHNPLTNIFTHELSTLESVLFLQSLDLSGVFFSEFDVSVLSVLPRLNILNLTGCHVDRVMGEGFQILQQLRVLDLRGCPMTFFPRNVFHGLSDLRAMYTDNYRLCCPAVLPKKLYGVNCKAPSNEVSSCEDLLRSNFFRICLCIFAVLACVGNLSSIFFRIKVNKNKHRTGFDMFVFNLCISDFLMGLYLSIIGLADRLYMGTYVWYDVSWRRSNSCKVAGFMSLLSSEVSAFIICLITLDRFLVLRFPFSQLRFSTAAAFLASVVVWMICIVVAAVPLMPMTSYWHFYGQTGICIPLPITRADFRGHGYSFNVMIVLNFALFVIIALGQLSVFLSVQKHKMSILGDTDNTFNRDQKLALRLITVAVSDFLCWFPVGLVGLMAANEYHIPSEVNSALAIFVLPLNSAINPFLYTLNIVLEKHRRSRERRMKQLLLSHLKAKGFSPRKAARSGCNHTREEAQRIFKLWLTRGILSHEHVLSLLLETRTVTPSINKTTQEM